MKQNYDNYFKNYYQENKETIEERRKAYMKEYNKKYYNNNREKILKNRKINKLGEKAG